MDPLRRVRVPSPKSEIQTGDWASGIKGREQSGKARKRGRPSAFSGVFLDKGPGDPTCVTSTREVTNQAHIYTQTADSASASVPVSLVPNTS